MCHTAKTTVNEPGVEDNEGAQELLCTTELPTQLEGARSHSMAVVTTPSMGAVVIIPHMGPTEELETVDLTPTTPDELENDTHGSNSGVADSQRSQGWELSTWSHPRQCTQMIMY